MSQQPATLQTIADEAASLDRQEADLRLDVSTLDDFYIANEHCLHCGQKTKNVSCDACSRENNSMYVRRVTSALSAVVATGVSLFFFDSVLSSGIGLSVTSLVTCIFDATSGLDLVRA